MFKNRGKVRSHQILFLGCNCWVFFLFYYGQFQSWTTKQRVRFSLLYFQPLVQSYSSWKKEQVTADWIREWAQTPSNLEYRQLLCQDRVGSQSGWGAPEDIWNHFRGSMTSKHLYNSTRCSLPPSLSPSMVVQLSFPDATWPKRVSSLWS